MRLFRYIIFVLSSFLIFSCSVTVQHGVLDDITVSEKEKSILQNQAFEFTIDGKISQNYEDAKIFIEVYDDKNHLIHFSITDSVSGKKTENISCYKKNIEKRYFENVSNTFLIDFDSAGKYQVNIEVYAYRGDYQDSYKHFIDVLVQ